MVARDFFNYTFFTLSKGLKMMQITFHNFLITRRKNGRLENIWQKKNCVELNSRRRWERRVKSGKLKDFVWVCRHGVDRKIWRSLSRSRRVRLLLNFRVGSTAPHTSLLPPLLERCFDFLTVFDFSFSFLGSSQFYANFELNTNIISSIWEWKHFPFLTHSPKIDRKLLE